MGFRCNKQWVLREFSSASHWGGLGGLVESRFYYVFRENFVHTLFDRWVASKPERQAVPLWVMWWDHEADSNHPRLVAIRTSDCCYVAPMLDIVFGPILTPVLAMVMPSWNSPVPDRRNAVLGCFQNFQTQKFSFFWFRLDSPKLLDFRTTKYFFQTLLFFTLAIFGFLAVFLDFQLISWFYAAKQNLCLRFFSLVSL